jgi:hypothetical protein
MGVHADAAMDFAERASSGAFGEQPEVVAIGNGLSAITYAILELSSQVEQLRRAIEPPPPEFEDAPPQ